MYSDPMTYKAAVQYHQEHLEAQAEVHRLLKTARARHPEARARLLLPRLREALASVWIAFICSWHAVQAGHAPSGC